MLVYTLGLILFFGTHSIRMVAPALRDRQVAANERRWKGLYALASLVGFVLIIWGYAMWRADAPQLYVPPDWGRHLTYPLVWAGLVLLAAAYSPTGRIKATVQHPMLLGTALWGLGHLLANGDAAGVLLFGVALVYGVADTISNFARKVPRPQFAGYRGDIIAIVIGTVVTLALLFGLHALLFGVSPLG